MPARNWKRMARYSMVTSLKKTPYPLWVEKPPVAVVVMELRAVKAKKAAAEGAQDEEVSADVPEGDEKDESSSPDGEEDYPISNGEDGPGEAPDA